MQRMTDECPCLFNSVCGVIIRTEGIRYILKKYFLVGVRLIFVPQFDNCAICCRIICVFYFYSSDEC